MNIYLLTQNTKRGYDMFDSFVAAAPNPEEARRMHPRGDRHWIGSMDGGPGRWVWVDSPFGSPSALGWVDPNNVTVTHIGIALEGTPPGVICASFNAG